MDHSRLNPSEEYIQLIEYYAKLHEFGDPDQGTPSQEMFDGKSLPQHAEVVRQILGKFQATSLLDYGCGKARGYQVDSMLLPDQTKIPGLKKYWGIDDIGLYDPAYKPYSILPHRIFDSVISTDVLEHCPESDIDWIIKEMFGLATKFVFSTVALYPAKKTIFNNQNAHITIKSAGWWVDKFEKISKESKKNYVLIAMYDSELQTIIQG